MYRIYAYSKFYYYVFCAQSQYYMCIWSLCFPACLGSAGRIKEHRQGLRSEGAEETRHSAGWRRWVHNDREEGANAGRGASLPHLHALMFPDTGVWGSYAVYGREIKGSDLILMSMYVAESIIATFDHVGFASCIQNCFVRSWISPTLTEHPAISCYMIDSST